MSPTETESETETQTRGRGARVLARAVPTVLALVLVALVVTSVVVWRHRQRDDQTPAALSAGRTAAVTFFSLDAVDPTRTTSRMLALSTGKFRTDYSRQRTTLVEQVRSKGLTVKPSVADDGTALEYLGPSRAQVLVAVNTTTKTAQGSTQTGNYRIRVLLQLVGDRWLVAGLEQVG